MPITRPGIFKPDLLFPSQLETDSQTEKARKRVRGFAEGARLKTCLMVAPKSCIVKKDLLDSAVRLVTTPPLLSKNLARAETIFSRLEKGINDSYTCLTWLGICGRLRGDDTTGIFIKILQQNPQDRLAQVNLAAAYICCDAYIFDTKIPEQMMTALELLFKKNDLDLFAKLLHAYYRFTFLHCRGEGIEELEQIYLQDKSYTPAITTMAMFLFITGMRTAGVDYATEAFNTNPLNFQSRNLFHGDNNFPVPNFKNESLRHTGSSAMHSNSMSIFYAAYGMQHPLFMLEADVATEK